MAYTNPAALTALQGNLQTTLVTISGSPRAVNSLVTQFLINPSTEVDWDNMNTGIQAFIVDPAYSGLAGLRVLVTLADGKVAYDTAKGVNNTYANYQTGTIYENHNTRIAIITAMLGTSGVGFETKYSNTTGQDQAYCAVRMGYTSTNGLGVLRLSLNNA
jgi:hypothetical protein